MKIEQELIPGTLIRRYKRFLADVRLESGEEITAHCPNSGSMLGCDEPGSLVLLSFHGTEKRKYAHTWEMVKVNHVWVGINTQLPNRIVAEAISDGQIRELAGYPELKREVRVGEHSRLDLLLSNGADLCYVEIKNVTLMENNRALFPDAVTTRGRRHLWELAQLKAAGRRAVIFFLIQRADGEVFAPADNIDAEYGKALREAHRAGVEILPYRAKVTPAEITIDKKLRFEL
ncbi:MAG: DNA/RNA nuclease SfsA [Calditrichaeota bacterium]|nr:DNA/RNA nuclease SfsA [Calditrichota bacterium]